MDERRRMFSLGNIFHQKVFSLNSKKSKRANFVSILFHCLTNVYNLSVTNCSVDTKFCNFQFLPALKTNFIIARKTLEIKSTLQTRHWFPYIVKTKVKSSYVTIGISQWLRDFLKTFLSSSKLSNFWWFEVLFLAIIWRKTFTHVFSIVLPFNENQPMIENPF